MLRIPFPFSLKMEDWPSALVAVSDEKLVGVIITNQEWVSDLWVLREHRRQGLRFYLSRGWQIAREFAHEDYRHAMLEMAKSLPEKLGSAF